MAYEICQNREIDLLIRCLLIKFIRYIQLFICLKTCLNLMPQFFIYLQRLICLARHKCSNSWIVFLKLKIWKIEPVQVYFSSLKFYQRIFILTPLNKGTWKRTSNIQNKEDMKSFMSSCKLYSIIFKKIRVLRLA